MDREGARISLDTPREETLAAILRRLFTSVASATAATEYIEGLSSTARFSYHFYNAYDAISEMDEMIACCGTNGPASSVPTSASVLPQQRHTSGVLSCIRN